MQRRVLCRDTEVRPHNSCSTEFALAICRHQGHPSLSVHRMTNATSLSHVLAPLSPGRPCQERRYTKDSTDSDQSCVTPALIPYHDWPTQASP